MQQSPRRPWSADDDDSDDRFEGAGLPIVIASLVLVILMFAATHAQAKLVDVVEFYNKSKDHCFITSIKEEIAGRGADARRDERTVEVRRRR